ncbi:MAG TPA: hypothetical protein VMH39_16355 [Gemmatimonadaceae bacterium]|nr:hypothetical protein [Gemmatimonadaceae bacterium]
MARRWLLVVGMAGLLARPARAQDSGDGFLFGEPAFSFRVRMGYANARAGSDIFSFTTQQLTLTRSDFSAPSFSAALTWRVAERTDLVLDAGYAGARAGSEFRDWVDQDSLPIQQTTTFVREPLTIGIKEYLTPRGHAFGHFAWVPSTIAPYVGLGGGAMWYQFEQRGSFVDFNTLGVFDSDFNSSGWTPTGHVLAGVDYALGPTYGITTEARYTWANAALSNSFTGFHRIDLDGYSVSAGMLIRF